MLARQVLCAPVLSPTAEMKVGETECTTQCPLHYSPSELPVHETADRDRETATAQSCHKTQEAPVTPPEPESQSTSQCRKESKQEGAGPHHSVEDSSQAPARTCPAQVPTLQGALAPPGLIPENRARSGP